MSRFDSASQKVNSAVLHWMGDSAIYRHRGMAAVSIDVVHDLRDVEVFDQESSKTVDTFEIWFWLTNIKFKPTQGDEIVFKRQSYSVVHVSEEADGGVWVRTHENNTGSVW